MTEVELGLFKSLVYPVHPKAGLQNKSCNPSKDNCFMLWSTLSLMASNLEKKDLIPIFRANLKILQEN